jgi:membrane protein implicated in regulation of membrane protease activity
MSAEQLFFSHPFWTWIALGAIFLIGELLTGSGWLLWPAGAAAAVGLITFTGVSWPWQVVAFVVLAIGATYVGRRFMPPPPKGLVDINDPTPRLVGRQGESVGPFAGGLGRVFVDGKEWSAELDGGGELAAKAKVEVVAILGGARLRVRAT